MYKITDVVFNEYRRSRYRTEAKTILFALFTFGILLTGCKSTGSVSSSKWKLIWEDQFTKSGLPNSNKWSFAPRRPPDWARFCTKSRETAEVKGGKLYLRGILNSSEKDTAKYQTGCIQTKGHFAFKYGKVEVRAKLSEGKGSWPAIWMMPQNARYGGWPRSGEIDIIWSI